MANFHNKINRIFVFAALFVSSLHCLADDSTTMKDILAKGSNMVETLEDKYDQEIVHVEYDLIFKSNNTKVVTRHFSTGYTYSVVAFADYRISDVDVKLYRKNGNNWEEVAKDTDASETALVSYKTIFGGEYLIEIKAHSFKTGFEAVQKTAQSHPLKTVIPVHFSIIRF